MNNPYNEDIKTVTAVTPKGKAPLVVEWVEYTPADYADIVKSNLENTKRNAGAHPNV